MLTRRITWTSQPPAGTPIDWGHPLAKKLVHAWGIDALGIAKFKDSAGSADGASGYVTDYGNKFVPASLGKVINYDNSGTGGVNSTDLTVGNSSGSGGPGSQAFTFFCFVKPVSVSVTQGLYSGGTGSPEVRISATGKIDLLKSNSALIGSSTGTLANNTWASIAVTYASPSAVFYINGVQSGTASSSQTLTLNQQFYLCKPFSGERLVNGSQVQIPLVFNGVLSSSEIAALHNNPWQFFAP